MSIRTLIALGSFAVLAAACGGEATPEPATPDAAAAGGEEKPADAAAPADGAAAPAGDAAAPAGDAAAPAAPPAEEKK
jgi:hypothetical protein